MDQVASGVADLQLNARVQDVLDQIRPHVQADGGDIELVDIVNGVVQIGRASCRERVLACV